MYSGNLSGQISTRQAGVRLGYRSGIFYQVSSETGNAETGYNALLSFNNKGVQLTGLNIVFETGMATVTPSEKQIRRDPVE